MDSCTYKYHKPIYSDGKIIYVDEYRYIVGIIGKGCHWVTRVRLTISYGNKTYKDEYHECICTHKYREGDKVKVIETLFILVIKSNIINNYNYDISRNF